MKWLSTWQVAVLSAGIAAAASFWASRLGQPGRPASAAGPSLSVEKQAPALPMELFATMGKEVQLLPGQERTLLEQGRAGTLTHLWFGGNWPGYADTRIRVYVDGERQAGIDMALFLGHGIGWGDDAAPWGTGRLGKTGRPSGIYNTYRIPFGQGVRLTAELAPEVRRPQTFWYTIRGLTNYPVQVGGIALPPAARLRLQRREQVPLQPLEEIEILNTRHKGLLYAVSLAATSSNYHYLEACLRAFPNDLPNRTGQMTTESGLAGGCRTSAPCGWSSLSHLVEVWQDTRCVPRTG
jgi:hypothetical protein